MRKRVIVIFLLIIILTGFVYLISRNSNFIQKSLKQAEQMQDTNPDSAIILLRQIKQPEKLFGKEQAQYALLMIRTASNKNKSFDSDSLIKIAVDYYKNDDDSSKKAWCYFYYGTYFQSKKDNKKALEYFQKASLAASNLQDYKLNTLIYNHWGTLLLNEKPYNLGINKQKKALEYAILQGDSLSIAYILRDLGLSYILNKNWTEALKVHERGIRLAKVLSNNVLLSSFYNNQSIIYWKKQEYTSALNFVNKSLSLKQDSIDKIPSESLKGILFFEMQQYDSARHYVEKRGLGETFYTKAYYYEALSLVEENLGHYKKALEYRKKVGEYSDSIQSSEKNDELIVLQRKYDYSIIENENNKLRLSQQRNENFMLIVVFIVIIITFIYLGYYYKSKKEKESLIQMKDDLLKKNVIELQKKTLQLQKKQDELHFQKEELSFYYQKEQELKSRILKMDSIVQKIESLNSFNEIKLSRSKSELVLSKKELADLEETVNLCYDNFATRLRNDFPRLKEDDIHLCCLIKIKVPNKSIVSLLNTNDSALKKRRYRIKHDRMDLTDETENLEQFLSRF